MKKLYAIVFLFFYANVAFGAAADCNDCSGNATVHRAYQQLKTTCECSAAQPGMTCCTENVEACKASGDLSPAVNTELSNSSLVQMVHLLTHVELDLYGPALLQIKPQAINFIPSKSSTERLAFLHLLRI